MPPPTRSWSLIKEAVNAWVDDRAASMGAALSYYTALSIGPLLIIAIAVAGLVFGRDAAQAAVVAQLAGLLGESGGRAVEEILKSTATFGESIVGIVVGVVTLVVTATTAFVELQDDLDRIWKAEPRVGSGIMNLIRSRAMSLGMVLFIGFLLAVSLVLSAAVSALGTTLFAGAEFALQAMTFVVSFAVSTVLFSMIYKVLPNARIAWEEVWIGAAITALLFEVGKILIGLYIGKSSVAASFGAAGPFVVLMLWIYYSTQIFLLGAEFTYAYAHRAQNTRGRQPRARVPGMRAQPARAFPLRTLPGNSHARTGAASSPLQAPQTTVRSTAPRSWKRPTLKMLAASVGGLVAGVLARLVVRHVSSRYR